MPFKVTSKINNELVPAVQLVLARLFNMPSRPLVYTGEGYVANIKGSKLVFTQEFFEHVEDKKSLTALENKLKNFTLVKGTTYIFSKGMKIEEA